MMGATLLFMVALAMRAPAQEKRELVVFLVAAPRGDSALRARALSIREELMTQFSDSGFSVSTSEDRDALARRGAASALPTPAWTVDVRASRDRDAVKVTSVLSNVASGRVFTFGVVPRVDAEVASVARTTLGVLLPEIRRRR